jgi:hypothetical protein
MVVSVKATLPKLRFGKQKNIQTAIKTYWFYKIKIKRRLKQLYFKKCHSERSEKS